MIERLKKVARATGTLTFRVAAFVIASTPAWALGGGRLAATQAMNGLSSEVMRKNKSPFAGSVRDIHERVQALSNTPQRREHDAFAINWHLLLADVILNAPEREYTRVRKALRRAQRAINKRLNSERGREDRRAA